MSEQTITSWPWKEGYPFKRSEVIGTDCACQCHIQADYWPKGTDCCGSLHKGKVLPVEKEGTT